MDITSVKYTTGGFSVNNQFFIPNDSDKEIEQQDFYYKQIVEWVENGGIIAPEFTKEELLANAKATKKAEINALRDVNNSINLKHTIKKNTPEESEHYFQRGITSKLALALASSSDTITEWVDANNIIVELTKDEVIAICAHISSRDTTEVKLARKRKDAVQVLTTIEEVKAFDINKVIV